MMRYLFPLIVVLTMGSIASAVAQERNDPYDLKPGEQIIKRDNQGRRTGTIERGAGGQLIERDNRGSRTGTIEKGVGGEYIKRDNRGRRTGTLERR